MTETEDPFERFAAWMDDAIKAEPKNPTAMSLATVDADGAPSLRMILLKGADSSGFVFYTNTESRKSEDLAGNTQAALCFYWKSLDRQVRVEGMVEPVSDDEADAYFASRSRDSRIGAWASAQSRPMAGRFDLEKSVAKYVAKFALGEVPRPPYWSGFRVVPQRIEFWREKPFRLHERLVFIRDGEGWRTEMLYP